MNTSSPPSPRAILRPVVDRAVELARTTSDLHGVRALAERVGVSVRAVDLGDRDHAGHEELPGATPARHAALCDRPELRSA